MECLPLNETFSAWLINYGSIALFVFLVLGIIALPIPDETLMIFAGVLIHKGKLALGSTVLAAYLGSICGITLSYIIGRTVGHYVIHKYGRFVGMTAARLETVESWLQKYGKWTLAFGYFLPGIRHFTGFATGMAYLPYREFALFAYTGAIVWVSTFLSIGYFFGSYCLTLFSNAAIGIDDLIIVLVGGLTIYLAMKYRKKRKS